VESAVIVRVSLPAALDRLRRQCVRDARLGVPAHVTLLYPFLEPTALKGRIRRTIASIAAAHPSFQFELSGPREWPDTVYAAVHPEDRFLAIHRELAAAFPDYPIYSRPGFELIPHVTIAESEHVGNAAPLGHPAWSTLPAKGSVDGLEVIAEGEDGRWRTRLTVPLAVRRPA
jgi:2'-5' RNA ligase